EESLMNHLPLPLVLLLILTMACLPLEAAIAEGEKTSEVCYPKALAPGDTIAIVAPAGPMAPEEIERGAAALETLGFQVRRPKDPGREHRFFAGDDKLRAEELMDAFADNEVDAIFAARGGYGTMRLLDRLD